MNHHRIVLGLGALLLGCPGTPYDTGEGPALDDQRPVVPAWENGNLGGRIVEGRILDVENPTEAELPLLQDALVTINGSFASCDSPLVTFGARNATIVSKTDAALSVLTPPGPVAGGLVELAVACAGGTTRVADAYEYVLGNAVAEDADGNLIDPEGNPVRRLSDLYQDEYASFALYYQAAPFLNWPDPVGYGFFHSQPTPRNSAFFGQKPGTSYAGSTFEQVLDTEYELPVVPAQIPEVGFEQPPQGEELDGGPGLVFWRPRDNSAQDEPLRGYAVKRRNQSLIGDPDSPDNHTAQAANNTGVWVIFAYQDDSGNSRTRYARVAQSIGAWCPAVGDQGEGCDGDADYLNRTRLPLDFRWKWLEPDTPSREDLAGFPNVSPEHVAYLDCVDAGNEADACEDDVALQLPAGTYEDVRIVRSLDEFDSFPWVDGGFQAVVEIVPSVQITADARWIDLPENAVGRMVRDNSNINRILYDGFDGIGENALPMGRPVYLSYEGGFFRSFSVPPKNADMEFAPDWDGDPVHPSVYAAQGDAAPAEADRYPYDDYPFVNVPVMDFDAFLGANSPFNPVDGTGNPWSEADGFPQYLGFPALLPEENHFDWRMSMPGGTLVDGTEREDDVMAGWRDTYFTVDLSVRDLDAPAGFGAQTPWRATAWAWGSDDYIVFPADTISTMPAIADITRPDVEDQDGANLLGSISMEVHRVASWRLGDEFVDDEGRAVIDIGAITSYYFHNQHSCFDGKDNDNDGFCDLEGCTLKDGTRLPPDPACIPEAADEQPASEVAACQDGEDNDGDGLTDVDDPDCESPNDTLEDASCSDGEDNDGDGWADLEDPGCVDAQDSFESGDSLDDFAYSYASQCNDSIDNDGDGAIDSEDAGCEDGADDDESGDTCGDGVDNNGDGWTDWEDLTCMPGSEFDGEVDYSGGVSVDFECSSFEAVLIGPGQFEETPIDEDADGVANREDPDCAWGWDPSGEGGAPVECNDRIDNDGDGWIDELDPECFLNPSSESQPPNADAGNCHLGLDVDGDGWIGADDPDCRSGYDDESFQTGLECNDGIDNDGDGDIDAADVDCPTGLDNSESE